MNEANGPGATPTEDGYFRSTTGSRL